MCVGPVGGQTTVGGAKKDSDDEPSEDICKEGDEEEAGVTTKTEYPTRNGSGRR